MKQFRLNKSLNVLKAAGHALGAYLISQGVTKASALHLGAGALLILKSFILDYFHNQAVPGPTIPKVDKSRVSELEPQTIKNPS